MWWFQEWRRLQEQAVHKEEVILLPASSNRRCREKNYNGGQQMSFYGVFKHYQDGTEVMIARSRSKTATHDYAESLEEDWDDPSGAWYDYRLAEASK